MTKHVAKKRGQTWISPILVFLLVVTMAGSGMLVYADGEMEQELATLSTDSAIETAEEEAVAETEAAEEETQTSEEGITAPAEAAEPATTEEGISALAVNEDVTVDLSQASGQIRVSELPDGLILISGNNIQAAATGGEITTGGIAVSAVNQITLTGSLSGSVHIDTPANVVFENVTGMTGGIEINADATLTLRNVSIDASYEATAAIKVNAQKHATLVFGGNNTLTSGIYSAGIHTVGSASASDFTTVTVAAETADATLTVRGGYKGAGIGSGNYDNKYFRVNITGGIIQAYGGADASAIGGGGAYNSDMEINISGGQILTAQGSTDGAPGIGAGRYCQGKMVINISGGEIGKAGSEGAGYDPGYGAFGGHCAAGIGAGNYWNTKTTSGIINISGGTIYNTVASDEGTGIGEGGNNMGNMAINISGGRIVHAKGTANGAGIGAGKAGDNGSTVQVIISGGVIDEAISSGQPGIGGGGSGAVTVKISGGTINSATGTMGIGAMVSGSPRVEITGGTVNATSIGSAMPAIGGYGGLLITGGTVTGTGTNGPGVGGNYGVEIRGDATVYGVGSAAGNYNGIGYRNSGVVTIVAENGVQPKVSATARNYAAIDIKATLTGISGANLYFSDTGTGSVTTTAKSPYGSDLVINPQGADENVASSAVPGKGWYEQLEDESSYAERAQAVLDWYTDYYYKTVTDLTGYSFDAWSYATSYLSNNNGVNVITTPSVGNWKILSASLREYYEQFVAAFAAYQSEGHTDAVRPARDWDTYPEEPEIVVLPHDGYTSFAYTGQEGTYVNEITLPSGQTVVAWTFDTYAEGETKDIALNAQNLSNPVPVHILGENGEEGIPSKLIYDKNIAADSAYPLLTPVDWYADDTIGFGVSIGALADSGYAQSKANPPTRAGYVFRGWSAFIGGEGQGIWVENVGVNSRIYGETTLYANWEPEVYSISYYMPQEVSAYENGNADLSRFNKVYSAEQLPVSSLTEPVAGDVEGHHFVGWQVRMQKEDGSLTPFELTSDGLLPAGTYGDLVLIAKYDTDKFVLSFELNGADTPAAITPAELVYNTAILDKVNEYAPARDGYDFAGWFTTEDFAEGTEVTDETRITDDMTVYAKWTEAEAVAEEPTEPPVVPLGDDPVAPTTDPVVQLPAEVVAAVVTAEPPAAVAAVEEAVAEVLAVETPLTDIDEEASPRAASENTWPLLNLILMALAVFAPILAVAVRRQREDEGSIRYKDLLLKDTGYAGDPRADEQKRNHRVKTVFAIVALAAAVLGLVFWLYTEDFTGKMVLTDRYTILQGCITVAAFIASLPAILARTKETEELHVTVFGK
ncbi:MAG: InlB B-repeat-containing protein [Clostridiales Family XIII bacterium]|jgi:uncharacterized repeat protein (TIGR02543 family)|nr:InlB B-repeat-containing protein [Clostridiales Family XIII bacterium]